MSKKTPRPAELARIRKLLQSTDPAADLPYDLRWALRILAGEEVAAPEVLQEEMVLALMEELTDRLDADALARLASGPHRGVAKAARTGLHRLRSHKVAVEIPLAAEAPPTGTGLLGEPELQGLMTVYDNRGQRVIWLPTPASKGIHLHQARISSDYGLIDFTTFGSTRGKLKTAAEKIRQHTVAPWVDARTAHWYVEQAAQLCREVEHGLPQGYVAASQSLGSPPAGAHPALSIAPGEVDPAAMVALLGQRALALWMPEKHFLQRLSLRLQEVSTSRVVVDDRQRAAQTETTMARALDEYYTPERIASARRVLLDTTHLLAAAGLTEAAGTARAAADLYLQPRETLLAHPLPRAFIERFFRSSEDTSGPGERTTESGLILPGR